MSSRDGGMIGRYRTTKSIKDLAGGGGKEWNLRNYVGTKFSLPSIAPTSTNATSVIATCIAYDEDGGSIGGGSLTWYYEMISTGNVAPKASGSTYLALGFPHVYAPPTSDGAIGIMISPPAWGSTETLEWSGGTVPLLGQNVSGTIYSAGSGRPSLFSTAQPSSGPFREYRLGGALPAGIVKTWMTKIHVY